MGPMQEAHARPTRPPATGQSLTATTPKQQQDRRTTNVASRQRSQCIVRVSVPCPSVAPAADLSFPPQLTHDRGSKGQWRPGCLDGVTRARHPVYRLKTDDAYGLLGGVWVCHLNTKPRSKKQLFLSNISVILSPSSEKAFIFSFKWNSITETGCIFRSNLGSWF